MEPTFSEGEYLKVPKYTLPASQEGEGIVLDIRWYDVSLYNSYVNLFNPKETKDAAVAGLQAEEDALQAIKWYYPQGCPADYPYAINWQGKGAWFCYSWDCSDKSDGGTSHCDSAPWRNGIDMVHICRPPADTPLPSPTVTDSAGTTYTSKWPQTVRFFVFVGRFCFTTKCRVQADVAVFVVFFFWDLFLCSFFVLLSSPFFSSFLLLFSFPVGLARCL